jgi:hypothetical protein
VPRFIYHSKLVGFRNIDKTGFVSFVKTDQFEFQNLRNFEIRKL